MKISASTTIAPIARWTVCEAGTSGDGSVLSPDVSFVEPMLRRRLSSLAKMTLCAAYDCAPDIADARFVYASRHGELARTTTMLASLAESEALSPAAFSLSVLNASTGLYSMLRKNVAPSTAVSAGRSSFGYGLLEACLQLASNPAQPVLYVYADEPAPAVYEADDGQGGGAHAVALLLQSSAALRVRCAISRGHADAAGEFQSRAFLRCLDQGRSEWVDAGKTWSWEAERR